MRFEHTLTACTLIFINFLFIYFTIYTIKRSDYVIMDKINIRIKSKSVR
jgi:hypothetical protein